MNIPRSALFMCALMVASLCGCEGSRIAGFYKGLVVTQFEMLDSGDSGLMYLSITGPPDIWFGIGLNNTYSGRHAMNNTYAIVVTPDPKNSVEEWILGDEGDSSTQKQLQSTITVVSNTVEGGIRTVVLWRSLKGKTADHKDFTTNHGKLSTMPIIEATGSGSAGAIFGNHYANRGSYTMNFTNVTRAKIDVKGDVDMVTDIYPSNSSLIPDQTTTTLTGPLGTSFSIYFNNHDYSFHVSEEGNLSEYHGTTKLKSIFENVQTKTSENMLSVTFGRPAQGPTSDYFFFDFEQPQLDYEIHLNDTLENKGSAWIASIHRTTGTQSDLSQTVVALEIDLCEISNEMTITMTGPAGPNTYFAVGFNATGMESEPWTIIVAGTVISEYHTYQGGGDAGVTPVPQGKTTTGFSVISTSTSNGMQTVKISRPTRNVVPNPESFDFHAGIRELPFISSHGPVQNGQIQYHSARKSSTISLNRITTFTAATKYSTANGDLSLDLTIDEKEHVVTMVLVGPGSKWFSVGFGGSSMNGTYAIVVHENFIEERTLGPHTAGSNLTNQLITVVSDSSQSGIRTVKLTRPVISNGDRFDFYTKTPVYGAAFGIVTIAGVGEGSELSYHGYNGAISGYWLALHFGSGGASPPPPPPPAPTPPPACVISDVRINPDGSTDRYDCKRQITRELSFHWKYLPESDFVYFAVENAAPGWIGLTIPNPGSCGYMFPAKGVIGTHESQMTYIVQSEGSNAVVKDHTQRTVNMSGSFDAGITIIRWARNVTDVPVIHPNTETCFNYAVSPSEQIGYHGPGANARGSFSLDLATGSSNTMSSPLKGKRITHGILMITAWCWFIPLGILMKRYGKPVFSLGISQFYGHIALVMTGVIITVSAYILATSNGFGGGRYSHGTIGVAVLVLAGANPVLGILGYIFVRDPKHPKRWMFNLSHSIIGRGVYVLACVQCFFGIESLNYVEGLDRSPYLIAAISGIVMSVTSFFICDALVTQFLKRKDEVYKVQQDQVKAALLEE